MRSVRRVVRTLIAVFLALAGPLLAAPAVQATGQEVHQQSVRTQAAASHQLTLSIDRVSPNFATPTSTVKVSGTMTNHTGSAITGLVVQLLTSSQFFGYRSQMDGFTSGSTALFLVPAGTPDTLPRALARGATVRWTVSFRPALAGYQFFGVYPLEVQATSGASAAAATDKTFLPFWPATGRPRPLNVGLVWPLIDKPQQGACWQTLATNSLAGSLGSKGRLGTLLAIGGQWTQQDHLTWAVDPALLSDATVMTKKYFVGGNAVCSGRDPEPASTAASSWLNALRVDTANSEMFATPYADTDVSALTHAGLDQNLRAAYDVGESVAGKIVPGTFGTNGAGTGDGGTAWLADGTADASVLTSLARDGGIRTAVLASGALPSTDPRFDNALARTTTGIGTSMQVLMADSQLTSILGSAPAGSSAAAQFRAEQDYLAETAMILAEAPSLPRSVVVAPPRHWNPPAAEATKLLKLTSKAPWLRTVGLSGLAVAASHLKSHGSLPGRHVSKAELSDDYLDQVRAVNENLALFKDLLYQPSQNLLQTYDAAVAATTSVAWRGASSAGGWLALTQLGDYLSNSLKQVRIITGKKLLLAGTSGETPVSVQNLLSWAVQVRVVATLPADSQLSVGKLELMTVQPGQTPTVRMSVQSTAIATTTMQLQLVTKNGSPLPWTALSLSVQVTRYGRALLVLIAAALGVLVLASVARWIRRSQADGKADGRSGGTG
jgi:hypothetical protein